MEELLNGFTPKQTDTYIKEAYNCKDCDSLKTHMERCIFFKTATGKRALQEKGFVEDVINHKAK